VVEEREEGVVGRGGEKGGREGGGERTLGCGSTYLAGEGGAISGTLWSVRET